jgi:hypothetical protein
MESRGGLSHHKNGDFANGSAAKHCPYQWMRSILNQSRCWEYCEWGEGRDAESSKLKGGAQMNGLPDVIVSLWFLPVILYAIIPLVMLCGWIISRLFMRSRIHHNTHEKQDGRAVDSKFWTNAKA